MANASARTGLHKSPDSNEATYETRHRSGARAASNSLEPIYATSSRTPHLRLQSSWFGAASEPCISWPTLSEFSVRQTSQVLMKSGDNLYMDVVVGREPTV